MSTSSPTYVPGDISTVSDVAAEPEQSSHLDTTTPDGSFFFHGIWRRVARWSGLMAD